jgi:hypothetical protein
VAVSPDGKEIYWSAWTGEYKTEDGEKIQSKYSIQNLKREFGQNQSGLNLQKVILMDLMGVLFFHWMGSAYIFIRLKVHGYHQL